VYGGAADADLARDSGFAWAGTIEFADLASFEAGSERTAQGFAVLPCVSQTGTDLFKGDFALELGEDIRHGGYNSAGESGQVEGLRQENETDAEMFEILTGGQPPVKAKVNAQSFQFTAS